MPDFLHDSLLLRILEIYAIFLVIAPILLRSKFRFKAKLNLQAVPQESLPPDVRQFMEPRIASITGLGFELVGYVNLGTLAGGTQSYMALCSNSKTMEWADVSVVKSTQPMKGYTEFITRCSNDAQVDTNSSSTAPVLFPNPNYHVFRFPQIRDAFTLYRVHRMLTQKHLTGSRPELPPKGGEIAELKRRLERYGPRQQEHGYMHLDPSGEFYRLTWKGAVIGAWRSIWPISTLRNALTSTKSQSQLRSLGVATARPS